jgi:hypothetical protein
MSAAVAVALPTIAGWILPQGDPAFRPPQPFVVLRKIRRMRHFLAKKQKAGYAVKTMGKEIGRLRDEKRGRWRAAFGGRRKKAFESLRTL